MRTDCSKKWQLEFTNGTVPVGSVSGAIFNDVQLCFPWFSLDSQLRCPRRAKSYQGFLPLFLRKQTQSCNSACIYFYILFGSGGLCRGESGHAGIEGG